MPAATLVLSRRPHQGQFGQQAQARDLDQGGPLSKEFEELEDEGEVAAGHGSAHQGQAAPMGSEPAVDFLGRGQVRLVPIPLYGGSLATVGQDGDDGSPWAGIRAGPFLDFRNDY